MLAVGKQPQLLGRRPRRNASSTKRDEVRASCHVDAEPTEIMEPAKNGAPPPDDEPIGGTRTYPGYA